MAEAGGTRPRPRGESGQCAGQDGSSGKAPVAQSHVGEALPAGMVTRLYEGMRRVDLAGKAQAPGQHVSQEQFTVSLSHLLKGDSEEKSAMILKMVSEAGGPVRARDILKFTEDLVGSVAHVLAHRQELRGWSAKEASGASPRVRALAARLLSELKLPGGEAFLSPQWLDCECDQAAIQDWVSRVPHVATFLSVVVHKGLLVLCSSLHLATLVPERLVEQGREVESVLDVLSVIYVNSHLPREWQRRWRLLFSAEIHGHSFSQLCGRVTQRGPCVAVLEDHDGHVFGGFASCSWEVKPQFQAWPCTRTRATTTTTCTSTMASRPSPTDWAWAGSTTTLGFGWTPILGRDTAKPSPRAPRTAARSCRPRRTSGLIRWRCGQSGTPRSCSWPRARRASWTWTPRPRHCWRSLGEPATARGSAKSPRMTSEGACVELRVDSWDRAPVRGPSPPPALL
nr:MTOR-associated protein MEAK7 isoform X3 [Oryctolagus cuniculus]